MNEEVKYIYLKAHPLFNNADEHFTKAACACMKVRTVARGENISYGEGEYSKIYLLIQGKIKISDFSETDDELIKDILTAPDIFGDLSLSNNLPAHEFAEALTANSIICCFNVAEFKKLLQESPAMAIGYAGMVNQKLKKMESRHSDLVFYDAKARLIRFIKYWAKTDGNRMGNKIVLHNYLTHSDIAAVIATSRQSVNVLLNELRDAGLLFYNRKKIELNDQFIHH
ncbi:Crp/Fnr family transcriptional regulator [Panacibacter sp. DH6]|uniref:Crp/Fnr family transcriptional regulator n=1 Tax=Panacibacter microcysteis TaxID=2793269 RepID=A0A931MD93_9BACT|nr:Crp/Fnr family transcriptional regulator [Panacibacter microcysteis]MBG9378248.1 Crp/Fnr family transcriptional regulator [Panacibacter microcysteis]